MIQHYRVSIITLVKSSLRSMRSISTESRAFWSNPIPPATTIACPIAYKRLFLHVTVQIQFDYIVLNRKLIIYIIFQYFTLKFVTVHPCVDLPCLKGNNDVQELPVRTYADVMLSSLFPYCLWDVLQPPITTRLPPNITEQCPHSGSGSFGPRSHSILLKFNT